MSAPNTSTDGPWVHHGGCHCGALRWEFVSRRAVPSLSPRACDCDFCTRHRAAWVSDNKGHLGIRGNRAMLQCLRQGSEQAEFLLCRHCGVLVAVIDRCDDGRLIGAVNRNAFDARDNVRGGLSYLRPALLPCVHARVSATSRARIVAQPRPSGPLRTP